MTTPSQHQTSTVQAQCVHRTNSSPAQREDHAIQWHRDLTAIIQRKIGLKEPFASQQAAAILEGLREDFGGQSIGPRGSAYMPAPSKSARNVAIKAALKVGNAAEVCKTYGISRSRLYQIVSQRK